MRRVLTWRWAALAMLGVASAACSAILGLDAPPQPDASVGDIDATAPAIDSAPATDAPIAPLDSSLPPTDAGAPPVCASLSGGDSGTTYFPLSGPGSTWEFFSSAQIPLLHPQDYLGGTFDGRYVYYAGRGGQLARYDTQGGGFNVPSAWTAFGMGQLGIAGGFSGAVFDGRYVYFVPGELSSNLSRESVVARFDSLGNFTTDASWATFDLATLSADGGAVTSGFDGATFDGRYIYFVPHNDGASDGRVVRYDTTARDAGAPPPVDAGDAGDAGDASADAGGTATFGEASDWVTYDLTGLNAQASGFFGAVYDGTSVYFVPQANLAYDSGLHAGASAIGARFHVGAAGLVASAWSIFDFTNVDGLAENFVGGGFDGTHVYFVPHASGGPVMQFDPTATSFSSISAWKTYDTARAVTLPNGALTSYAGAAFDGRFLYLIPSGATFGTVLRYDTLSTFTADCAWSQTDLTALDSGAGGVAENFAGAVFDGQYLYLVPQTGGVFARFTAKNPPSQPVLPAYHGSFL